MPDQCRMPSETEFHFKVMGNTDNAYDVIIDRDAVRVWCSCPDCDARGNFCKHLMFVLIRVIGIPEQEVCEDYFDITERCIGACRDYFERRSNAMLLVANEEEEKRKPIEEDDDCPICYERFVDTKNEATVWCKASCGKSVHTVCFQKWTKAKRDVDCVYCRAKWKW
jgi:hypothetical protein